MDFSSIGTTDLFKLDLQDNTLKSGQSAVGDTAQGLSAGAVSGLSAGASNAASSTISVLDAAALQNQALNSAMSAYTSANDMFSQSMKEMAAPLLSVIDELKPVPPKIRSIVDIQGAMNGMYKTISKAAVKMQKQLSGSIISSEVPITVEDYEQDPLKYPDLDAIYYQKNEITEEDCKKSGYTKIKYEMSQQWIDNFKKMFQKPEDDDIVAKQMEKLLNTTIKTAWAMLKPPIATIGSIAPIDPITTMVPAVTDSIDGIVKVVATRVSDKKLNEMIAKKEQAEAMAKAEADKAVKEPSFFNKSPGEMADAAMQKTEQFMKSVKDGASSAADDLFSKLPAPELPDDIKSLIEDYKDSITMVKDNLSNIYIVILFKLIGQIVKCLMQIVGVIGVPKLPAPLSNIAKLQQDAQNVMTFVMGLPMSLVKCTESVIKRKVKMVQVAMTPIPPPPLPTKVPLPPQAKDVIRPELTWDDVKTELKDKYGLSDQNAGKFISDFRKFYDGSDITDNPDLVQRTGVIAGSVEYDDHAEPQWTYLQRVEMQPVRCMKEYLPSNTRTMQYMSFDKEIKMTVLKCPAKPGEATRYSKRDEDGQLEKIDYTNTWTMYEYTGADSSPAGIVSVK